MSRAGIEMIAEFSVEQLLSDDAAYLVPMYQRNYAWGEGEINQLIQDVADYKQKGNARYYIGTLVVYRRLDGSFEVIDGQQRFTTLSLIATYLKNRNLESNSPPALDWYKEQNIDFESRPISSATFAALSQRRELHLLNGEGFNEGIVNGYSLIQKSLQQLKGINLEDFANYLFNNVQIMRVEVPEKTDLNHYFEIMNNRGEQLEKHEVLKAKLMSVLQDIADPNERQSSVFALQKVWESCSNMERYIQYGFTPDERHKVFGNEDWGQFTVDSFDNLLECIELKTDDVKNKTTLSLAEIVKKPSTQLKRKVIGGEEPSERFNSVINFSNFLLHVLRVYTEQDVALDDKQLIDQFEEHLLNTEGSIERVKEFIFALLKCKYLFDQYVIKREFSQGKDAWSLKRLKWYSAKSASFVNSFDGGTEEEGGYEGVNRHCLMLLAAFHVSTPTLVYKHWLNAALYFLYNRRSVSAKAFLRHLNKTAKRFVFERFLVNGEGKSYYQMIYQTQKNEYPKNVSLENIDTTKLYFGNIENNFIFNYLDFLLWFEHESGDAVVKEFEFTFRSSVEHFYPQHPMDGFSPLKGDALHQFGNLCLISHSKNSRLSNFPPKAKLAHFAANIKQNSIDSLKLYKMIQRLESKGDWSRAEIEEHGKEMLDVLCASTAKSNN